MLELIIAEQLSVLHLALPHPHLLSLIFCGFCVYTEKRLTLDTVTNGPSPEQPSALRRASPEP